MIFYGDVASNVETKARFQFFSSSQARRERTARGGLQRQTEVWLQENVFHEATRSFTKKKRALPYFPFVFSSCVFVEAKCFS
jgi:hypothetical protein